MKRERLDLERFQNKINVRIETIEKKEQRLDELSQELQQKERDLSRSTDVLRANENKIKALYTELIAKLENISGMTRDDARKTLFDTIESEVRLTSEKWVAKIEEEARQTAKEKAIQTVVGAMQRYTADQVSPHSSSVVHLPSDDNFPMII